MNTSGWRGVATGALALVVLETLVQPSASTRVGSLFALPGSWASKFLDPAVPAFKVSTGAKPSSATSGGTTAPAVLTLPQFQTGGGSTSGSGSTGGQIPAAGGFKPTTANAPIST